MLSPSGIFHHFALCMLLAIAAFDADAQTHDRLPSIDSARARSIAGAETTGAETTGAETTGTETAGAETMGAETDEELTAELGGFGRISFPYFAELGARFTLGLRPGILAASIEVSEVLALVDDCAACSRPGIASTCRVEMSPIAGSFGRYIWIYTQARFISTARGYGGGIAGRFPIDDIAALMFEIDITDFNHDFTGGARRRSVILGITTGLAVRL
jgi:hypothetical protein